MLRTVARTTALLPHVRERYPPSRVGFVYGEDMSFPIGDGLPVEGIQRAIGSPAPLPPVAEAARWGTVFQRELYDDADDKPHDEQALAVPGVADRVERQWSRTLRSPVEVAKQQKVRQWEAMGWVS